MPPEMLSPGVYVTEVDYSAYVAAISTSTFGMVGVFEKGPIGQPTLVTSFEEAQRVFGTYLDAQGFYGMLALKSFFENGGARAYVVRTCKHTAGVPDAAKSTASLVDRNGTPAPTLQVDALTPGAWGNKLSVAVSASVAYPTTGIDLTVKRDGVVVETFKDLLIGVANVASEDYVEKRINGISTLITVRDLVSASAAPANLPVVIANSALASGVDGLAGIGATDFVGDAATRNGLYALDPVEVNFIAIPGEADAAISAALATGLVTYAENRKDCVAIVEAPQGTTRDGLAAFRSGAAPWSHAAFNSTFAGLYGPWLIGTHPVTGREVALPPSGFVAGIYARNDQQGAVWTPPAGLNRATVRGALRPEVLLSKGDLDLLYSKQVNPIAVIVGALTVYGQKTLALKASKLDRIHVRRLMAFIEKSIANSAQFLVFEPASQKTWDAFLRLANPFLRGIQSGGGLTDFKVQCDDKLNTPAVRDRNEMKARIGVKPVGAAEFIDVEFGIAPTGADFSEL